MKKSAYLFSIVLLLCICIPGTVNILWGDSEEIRGTERITGKVLDIEGLPIQDVRVTLEYEKYAYKSIIISDNQGGWFFNNLHRGILRLTFEKDGYAPTILQFDLKLQEFHPKITVEMKKIEDLNLIKNWKENTGFKTQLNKAADFFRDAKYEDALAVFLDLRDQYPSLYELGMNIGDCLTELQRYDEAIKEYEQVSDALMKNNKEGEGKSDLARLYASIGNIHMRRNNLADAGEYFKKSLELNGNDYKLAFQVAEILFLTGKPGDAVSFYKTALKLKPDLTKAYIQLGYCLLDGGDVQGAMENFSKFIELEPDSTDAITLKELIHSLQ